MKKITLPTVLTYLKTGVFRLCLAFSLIITALAILCAFSVNNALPCDLIFGVLLFSFLLAVCFAVADVLQAVFHNQILREAVGFFLTLIAYIFVFCFGSAADAYLGKNIGMTNRLLLVTCMILLYIGVYVIVLAVRFGATAIKKKHGNEKKPYTPIYAPNENGGES